MQQEIIVSQNDINNINVIPIQNQSINLNNVINDNINISEEQNQNINVQQEENQTIYIDDKGVAYNITDVLVNGISVVSNNIAYVVVPTKLSELENNVGYLTSESDPTVPMYIKQITLSDINNWNNKQDLLVSGTNIKTINNNSLLGSGNISINPSYTAGTGINITGATISNTITSYNDLTNLPTIPEYTGDLINNSNFVSSNELAEVAFNGSYNALSDTPIIPDSTSELTNDSGFIDKDVNNLTYYTLSSSLSTVATSGNYNDLSNKPTIPSVNDATLTIQKNGSNVNTFTANASSNVTANITVPTQTSELTNNSGFIDNTVNNLLNYLTTTEIETKLNDVVKYKILNLGGTAGVTHTLDIPTNKTFGGIAIYLTSNNANIIQFGRRSWTNSSTYTPLLKSSNIIGEDTTSWKLTATSQNTSYERLIIFYI